jgi:hypothetical protein
MIYHPGQYAAYAIGTLRDVREYSVEQFGVHMYANTPTSAMLCEQTANGLRSYPTHSGGAWKLASDGWLFDLTDEEAVLLGEEWAAQTVQPSPKWAGYGFYTNWSWEVTD